ncbi:MAG TPA: SDR family NAD(P)-dependent oxidoreductase [Trebonia sp.]|jgi:NAD(P)-dependent dehydrogenase (short-subunit alcohol dehydrogenase family)|nr:SDR family NAD(P)-dependent oxidoreductase [Trebonia sp.]
MPKPFTDYTADDYALMTGVNLNGFFWLTQRVIAEMLSRHGGHVVNISATVADYASSSAASASTPSPPASSRRRYTRRKATPTSATRLPRSATPARSATSSTASCSSSQRPTSRA